MKELVRHSQQRLGKRLCTRDKHSESLILSETMKTSAMSVMKYCSMSKLYWRRCHYLAQERARRNDDRSG
jgi:hypothetical protein